MQAVEDAASLRAVDVFVLAVVHEAVSGRRRAVQSILRNKIRAGVHVDTKLHAALSANPAVTLTIDSCI